MNRLLIFGGVAIAAVALAGGGLALAHGGWRGHHGPGGGPRFVDLAPFDLNKDGKITRAEVDEGAQAQFAKADSNGDGKLDPAEAKSWHEASRAAWKAAHPDMPSRSDKRDAARDRHGPRGDMFKRADWNLDGGLSFEEFVQPIRHAAVDADRNGSGSIAVEDLKKRHGRHGGGWWGHGRGDDEKPDAAPAEGSQ